MINNDDWSLNENLYLSIYLSIHIENKRKSKAFKYEGKTRRYGFQTNAAFQQTPSETSGSIIRK